VLYLGIKKEGANKEIKWQCGRGTEGNDGGTEGNNKRNNKKKNPMGKRKGNITKK
jgi:hypothetical protein